MRDCDLTAMPESRYPRDMSARYFSESPRIPLNYLNNRVSFFIKEVMLMAHHPHFHILPDQIYSFDARGIAKRFRHAAIFGALDALVPGETMRFINDHDPLPLLDQLRHRYGESVSINYVQREPGAIVIDFVREAR